MRATKGNRIPPDAKVPVWFRRGHGGFLEVVELVEAKRAESHRTRKRVLDVLIEMDPDNNGVRLLDWRQRCAEMHIIGGPTDDAKKKAMTRALKSLGNRIEKDGRARHLSAEHAFIRRTTTTWRTRVMLFSPPPNEGTTATRNEGTGHPLKGVVPCPLAFRVPSVPSLSLRCPFVDPSHKTPTLAGNARPKPFASAQMTYQLNNLTNQE